MHLQNGHPSQTLDERSDNDAYSLEAVVEQLSTAAAALEDRASELSSRARSLAARIGKRIQDHPIAAIGIALGCGYVVMRLVRR